MKDRRISHYRILDRLGGGGMGEVYVAEDETLRRKVALKAIRAEFRRDPDLKSRFLREARVLSQLDHPNICRIFDSFAEDGIDYLVLELIEGEDLERAIAAGLEPKRALAIALAIADALAAAHAAGVVHRDVKPGNVMVTRDGVTKVLDFGLSRVHRGEPDGERAERAARAPLGAPQLGEHGTLIWESAPAWAGRGAAPDASLLTAPGGLLGTVRYMSPEQARGEPATAASDMYALGLVLQELFTGEPAHDRGATRHEVLERAREARSAPVRGVDRDIADLIGRLKSAAPTQRPTAVDVLRRLRRVQQKPQRRLRRALAAGLALAALAGAVKYTLDLRRERGRAEGRTEAALGMMRTLFEKQVPVLAEVNRLDAFDAAAEAVQAYFSAMRDEELTDLERLQLARLLQEVGKVRSSQGRAEDAELAFREALSLAEELDRRHAHESEFVLALGAAHFYVGELALGTRGDPAAALASFRSYLEAAERNEALDPDPVNAVREVTYARNAIAATLLQLGRGTEALAEQSSIVELLRASLDGDADAEELRVDFADSLSWLGSAREEAGDLASAHDAFTEELALRRELAARDPRNAAARVSLAYCLTFLADARLELDRPEDALAAALEARDLLAELNAGDPGNAELAGTLGFAWRRCGNAYFALRRVEEACDAFGASLALLEDLVARDPGNAGLQQNLAPLALDYADARLAAERFDGVEPLVARTREVVASDAGMLAENRRSNLARASIALGRALAGLGDEAAARAEWSGGLARLASDPPSRPDPTLRAHEASLLALLRRRDEAEAILAELPRDDRRAREARDLLEGR